MFPSEWYDTTFEIFKNCPNSTEIFDLIKDELNKYIEEKGSNTLLETSNGLVSSYCGSSFKKDQLLYHCSDCALDDTCVLCETCFNFEAHKDHNYWYTIAGTNSGSCDCGEDDSWKNDLKCSHHSTPKDSEVKIINEFDLDHLKNVLEPILRFVMQTFYNFSQSKNETKTEDCILVLYNDENHSFDDVIDTLTSEIDDCEDTAEFYAGLVDIKGFAPILKSNASTCLRISRKFKTLTTSAESENMVFDMILCTEIISFCSKIIPNSSILRKFFVDWFLTDASGRSDGNNNLEMLLSLDHLLWKSVRLGFNEILNSCNAIDQESKKQIGLTYCNQYKIIFDAFWKEKREPHLSVTNFSVQIFTLTPVAEYCLENSTILEDLFGTMIEILEPGFHPSSGLNFSKLRGFNFRKFSVLTHDALHLARNVRTNNLNIPNIVKVVESFMYMLSLLTHMQGHFIKTGDHVAFDVDNNDTLNYICFEVQSIAQAFAKIIISRCEFSAIWSLFEKQIDQKSSLSKLVNGNFTENTIQPLFKSKKRCSFFGSLAWFYSALVMEAMKNNCELKIPSKIVKCFTLDSLHRIIFSAEVKSGFWVRNGLIVRQQEYFYSSTVYHHLTYFSDLFNCIAGSRLIDRIPFIEMIIKHSCVIDYLQNQDQAGAVIDQFMIIFINCCSSSPLKVDFDQILINSLCTESQPKSLLIKILPDIVSDAPDFRMKILQMTSLTSVNSIGSDAKLEIKNCFMDRFDPFYWAFPMNYRLKAWSYFKEKRGSSFELILKIFSAKYPISVEISKQADFLIEMLLNSADSSSTDHHFALEMILAILKSITNITSDSDCLNRISNCIEKFKLKKNIPENILLCLASICPSDSSTIAEDNSKYSEGKQIVKEKRNNIMASFKRTRENFISEPLALIEDSEQVCVVCSESGDGADGNFLGFPIQLNKSTKMSNNLFDTLFFVRGCYHLVHLKCYNSLPFISSSNKDKKCTLCNSAIDYIIPLSEETTELLDLNIKLSDSFSNSNYENKVRSLHFSSVPDLLFILLDGLCSTLVFIEETSESLESIPLHRILTLTQLKRYFVKEFKKSKCKINEDIRAIFDELILSISNPCKVMKLSIISLLLYLFGVFSIEDFSLMHSIIVSNFNNKKYFNFALNFVLNESLSRNQYFPSMKIIDSPSSANQFFEFKMNLIDLPHRHDLFLKTYLKKPCRKCKTIPKSGALCLLCGTLVCVGQQCCKSHTEDGKYLGECNYHKNHCSGSTGIFLLIRSCALLLISDSIGTIVPAPYVNVYGEHDFDLSSSSALFLNTNIYRGKLTDMWRNCEVRDFILRNMDNSRITSNSWSML